jgi:heme-degrading monooxygenase HmoA
MALVPAIASFHLVREARAATALARLALDRRLLRDVPGLRFWRLLGTGSGSSTGPGADLHRTALFAVWTDEDALERFFATMAPRWDGSLEAWHVRLRRRGGHGSWRGFDVLAALEPGSDDAGPVAVVTRAQVHVRAWRRFRAAAPAVDAELAASPGLLAVVGVGEAPIGRLGTFSLWRDAAAVREFVARGPAHRDVVRRTRAEQWYGEELFATFSAYRSSGSWDGRDPLADTGTSIP